VKQKLHKTISMVMGVALGMALMVAFLPQLVWASPDLTTWKSYDADNYTTEHECSFFSDGTNHVYMHGTGCPSGDIKVGYYDGNDTLVETDTYTAFGGGNLSSECLLTDFAGSPPTAAYGSWRAMVFNQSEALPGTVGGAYADPDLLDDDGFWVELSAIPEFPTVIAGIGVAGLCFGIYYWMRKKRLKFKM